MKRHRRRAACSRWRSAAARRADHKTHLYLQRFFGECGAEYGGSTDVSKAEGECGIITTMINRFNAENPDIQIDVNVVAWPGYPQLTAQMAARDPPDLVTMHEGVISDYAPKGLLEPVDGYLRQAGISAADFTDASRAGRDHRTDGSTAFRGTRTAACSTSTPRCSQRPG